MEEDLNSLREEIDAVDSQIVSLYKQRMQLSGQIADTKIASGKGVYDRGREREKIERICSMADDNFTRTGLRELFSQLMSMSRMLQYQKLTEKGVRGSLPFIRLDHLETDGARVVYQGVEGAYSEKAVIQYFGQDVDRVHVETFRDAMNVIADGAADYAVLPIENSSAGIVAQNYDMLAEFENYIVADVIVKIEHCLLGLPEAKISDIRYVYSHAQALAQCRSYLEAHYSMEPCEVENTAVAAKKVKEDGKANQAAIASEVSAGIYGLKVLDRNISLSEENFTRFIVVTNQRVFQKDAKKISISFQLPHEEGSLYRLMSHFIFNGLNMTKIESRPILGRPWEYQFFVDFEGNLGESAVKNAIRGIRDDSRNLRILGNY